MRRASLAVALAAVIACSSRPSRAPAATGEPNSATASTALDALAERLLAARTLRIRTRLASGGRIESRFDGTFLAGAGARVRIALEGSFGGRDASAYLVCDGVKMRGGGRGYRFEFDAPPWLRERMVVGFVRMGLAHDAATLAMGKPPDHLNRGVAQSFEVLAPSRTPGEPVRGAPTESWNWALLVERVPAADQELWLDTRTHLPVRRRGTMHFPEGDVDFGEEYDEVTLDGPVDDATFAIVP
jgi:hypothetical protein